jgi:hypothetical protein
MWLLATSATGTALCMSVLAGWQRGGWLSERLVWVATGAVLVIGAHLLPALCRSMPLIVRGLGTLLWAACMVATSYGHATFFLLSQQHAGEVRAAAVVVPSTPPHRNLTAVMTERADVTASLALANDRHCPRDCTALLGRRLSLATRLDALNAEADAVRRQQAIEDQILAQQEMVRADPVTSRLRILLGLSQARVDLFAGLAFSAVLESVACLLWWIAFQSRDPVTARQPDVLASVTVDRSSVHTASPGTVTTPRRSVSARGTALHTEVTQLARDIEAGHLRPTVSGIRRHLGCSQAKASALRRQLITPPA